MQVNLIHLSFFSVFLEYFIGIILLYSFFIFVILINNIYGIFLQNIASDCFGFILVMGCFLILNENCYFYINFVESYIIKYIGFNKYVIIDYLSIFSKFLICLFSLFYFFLVAEHLYELPFEFILLVFFAILGLMFMCSSNDLILMFISIELASLTSYLLASFKKHSKYSVESGLKYLIVGAVSTSFFLLGSSFFYYYTGSLLITDFFILFDTLENLILSKKTINFNLLNETYKNYHYGLHCLFLNFNIVYFFYEHYLINKTMLNYNEPMVQLALLLIMFSIFIKLSLAPFHLWSLNVYESSPTVAGFFFATITKLSFFVFLCRICYSLILIDFYSVTIYFYSSFIGFISVFVGSFGNLRQKRLKTLLAYSSVTHMGYCLLSFSTGSILGVEMLYFYLFVYMVSNIVIWYVLLYLKKTTRNYKNKKSIDLGDFVLLNNSNKGLAFGLLIVFFSIAGIPPFIGFFAKLGIFVSLISAKYYLITLLSIVCSLISTFYYIRLIKILYFENVTISNQLYFPIKSNKSIIFCFLTLSLIFLFINPTFIYLIIYKLVICLYV